MRFAIIIFLSGVAFAAQAQPAQQSFSYRWPEELTPAKDFDVYINDQKQFVYNTPSAAFVSFPLSGPAMIRVVFGGTIHEHDIRPLSKNIASTVYRNEIRFSLQEPAKLSVEINKNIKRPLLVFANAVTPAPSPSDPNTLVFAAGKVHHVGTVTLKSNQTVHIEGGAVVRGSFVIDKCSHTAIRGNGVIDNSHYAPEEARPVQINRSSHVAIEGIIIADSKHWTCGAYASTDVTYRDFKIVSDNNWDDGIDIVGSRRVTVDNCFIKTKDDCIAIKAGITYFQNFDSGGTVSQVEVKNSVIWNGVWGNALEIGFETRTDTIHRVLFSNLDIIHTEGPEGTFTIHNGDRARVSDVRYENIRVEDARGYLIDLKILQSRYSKDKQRGHIRDVYFKDIAVEGEIFPTSLMMGYDEAHTIDGVTLDNVVIHGKKVTSTYSGMIATIHAAALIFK